MRSLNGVRVLVTRARGQASGLLELLEAEGAEAIAIPAIEIAPPDSWCGMDAALASLRSYEWVVFTSANAVRAFSQRTRMLKVAAKPRRVAVIGPATGMAILEEFGREADLVPGRYVAEGLAEALSPLVSGAAVLLVRAAVGRDVLPEGLAAAGAVVTVVEAYKNVVPSGSIVEIRELFGTRPPDAVTFTSGSTVGHLAELFSLAGVSMPEGVVLASIGPVTSGVMREVGWEPTVEAKEASVSGLVCALKASAP